MTMDTAPRPDDQLDERLTALYVTCNPPELSEEWYLVGDDHPEDDNLHDITVKEIHLVVPDASFDTDYAHLCDEYGEVQIVGKTYGTKPYCLGYKRIDERRRQGINNVIDRIYYRPNYLAYWANRAEIEGNPLCLEYKNDLENMGTAYLELAEELKADKRATMLMELSKDDAWRKAGEFFELDGTQERVLHVKNIDQTHTHIQSLRGILPM